MQITDTNDGFVRSGMVRFHKDLVPLMQPIDEVLPAPYNYNNGDVEVIAKSIEMNGMYRPVQVQRSTGNIIAGNHTWMACQMLGAKAIPVVYLDVDDVTAKRIMVEDNEAARKAIKDNGLLLALLDEIHEETGEYLASITERDVEELRALAEMPLDTGFGQAKGLTVPDNPVTKAGDVWLLGDHRLICGDSADPAVFEALLQGEQVNLAFTSPPYADRRTYDETSGFKPIAPEEYVDWFAPVAANVKQALKYDGSWFVNIKAGVTPDRLDTELYVMDLVLAHVRQWGWHFATEFCWERSGVPKNVTQRFKNQFEPIFQFTLGQWKMRPEAVMHYSTEVPDPTGPGVGNTGWGDRQGDGRGDGSFMQRGTPGLAFPGNRLPTFNGTQVAVGHTAAFPLGLPVFFINAYTDPGDNVLDPFCGAGTTILAADDEDRTAFGIEISPGYCDVICARYQEHTGVAPVLEATGQVHDFSNPGAS